MSLVLLLVLWFFASLVDYILQLRGSVCLTPLLCLFFSVYLSHPMSSPPDQTEQNNGHSVSHNSNPDLSGMSELASAGSLGRGSPSNPTNPTPPSYATFSDALRFGVESHHSPVHSPVQGHPENLNLPSAPVHPLSPNERVVGSNLDSTPPCGPLPELSETPSNMDDLRTLCLLAKLWGESLPVPLIIS